MMRHAIRRRPLIPYYRSDYSIRGDIGIKWQVRHWLRKVKFFFEETHGKPD